MLPYLVKADNLLTKGIWLILGVWNRVYEGLKSQYDIYGRSGEGEKARCPGFGVWEGNNNQQKEKKSVLESQTDMWVPFPFLCCLLF